MRLHELGWDETCARHFEAWAAVPYVEPGRIAIAFNHNYRVYVDRGELDAQASGRLKHQAQRRSEMPAVGDWAVIRRQPGQHGASIQALLPRRTRFSRKVAGHLTDEQVVAANVDVVFLVMSLDEDFNLRRLERYLLMARESGAAPVVLLTKPDVCDDTPARLAEVVALAGELPVHAVSPTLGHGLADVSRYLTPGCTGALLGSSGVGKSTIINRLAGSDIQRTGAVRPTDSKGRHITTHRELIALPDGGLIIDTPGMRELQLWDAGTAVSETFEDIEALAPQCYFSDCRHRGEPRCAVAAAVAGGAIPPARLESYVKLQDELAFLAKQQDARLQIEDKRRSRVMGKALRARLKDKGRG